VSTGSVLDSIDTGVCPDPVVVSAGSIVVSADSIVVSAGSVLDSTDTGVADVI
jgi:hypothetical protein